MPVTSFFYFDIGGVLLLDYSGTNKWQEMKANLGITEKTAPAFDAIWQKHRSRICVDCDVDTLLPLFETIPNIHLPKNYSMILDFVNRFEQNPTIWPIAKQIKAAMPVGLLTNAYPRMLPAIQQNKLLPNIEWDVVIDSSVVGFQKPQPEIFALAEQRAQVKPNKIFYVDNKPEFTTAAAARGWQTMVYDPQNVVESNQKIIDFLQLEN